MNLSVTNAELLPEPTRRALDVLTHSLNTIGEWKDQPFDATHFRGSGTMTWTVDSAYVTTFAYSLQGSTLKVAFVIDATTVAGTVSTQLQIRVPAGLTAKRTMAGAFFYYDNGTSSAGSWQVLAGERDIQLFTASLGNWTASTSNTGVYGTIEFEVQT